MYQPRKQQGKADALSRCSYLAPKPGDPAFDHQKHVLLGPDRLQLLVTKVSETLCDSNFFEGIRAKIYSDDFAQDILDHIIPNRGSSS
jgi:hypothetical protein